MRTHDAFQPKRKSLMDAGYDAARIAFGPIAFQAARVLREAGVLRMLSDRGLAGASLADICETVELPEYGVRVLIEAALGMGLVYENGDRYLLTKTGTFIEHDEITRVNMDFVHDVCFRAMFKLEEAIREGKPAGLTEFGEWDTVYQALSSLPDAAKKSWFAFDHHYSDTAFPLVLPRIFAHKPETLLDIGGNTGKWAMRCAEHDPDVKVTIVDLPGQLARAAENVREHGFEDRITGHPLDARDPEGAFPAGADAVWMSQFLVCFSLDEVEHILARAAAALNDGGRLYILDTYWDRQENEIVSYCLVQTSLYFTCLANGNSQMWRSTDIISRIEKAGMVVEQITDGIGLSHSLIECVKRG